MNIILPISQSLPFHPSSQTHSYVVECSIQVPLFRQGFDIQTVNTVSQFLPLSFEYMTTNFDALKNLPVRLLAQMHS